MSYVPFGDDPTADDERVARRLRAKRRAWRLVRIIAVVAVAVTVFVVARERLDVVDWTGSASAPAQPGPVEPGSSEPGVAFDGGIPKSAEKATVLWVHDGDTLHIRTSSDDDVTVRLNAIDTPEIGENLECYGEEATDVARTLLPEGATVWVTADERPEDRFGRSLLYVFTESGVLVNEQLVSRGAAVTLFIEDDERYRAELESAEAEARANGLGMWGAC